MLHVGQEAPGDLHGDLLLAIVLQPSTATHCSGAQPLGRPTAGRC
jgi:hypothetical protein